MFMSNSCAGRRRHRSRRAMLAMPFLVFCGGVTVGTAAGAVLSPVPASMSAGGTSSAGTSFAGASSAGTSSAAAGATVSGVRQSRLIGRSVQGRAIVAHQLGNPDAPTKVLVLGSMHGFPEQAGEQVVTGIMSMGIPTNLDLWVVPTINPDGNALRQRANARHVDLNRDWDNQWVHIPGTPGDAFGNHGNGSVPWSQPETRAMRDFLVWLRPSRMVSIHQPLGGVDTTDGGAEPQGQAFRNALSADLGLPLKAFTCGGVCHGTMTGWLTRTSATVAITVEFGSAPAVDRLRGPAAAGIIAALAVGVSSVTVRARGVLEQTVVSPGTVRVRGWALDPLFRPHSTRVAVQVDGRTVAQSLTSQVRTDVNRAQRTVGRHGFDLAVKTSAGRHRVCVSGGRYGSSPTVPTFLARGCVTVTVPPFVVIGRVEKLDMGAGRIQVGGWAFDPQDSATSGTVRVLLDGRRVADILTSVVRRDVNSRMHVTGRHGFARTVTATPGRHSIEVIALARNTTSTSRVLLRRAVTVGG